MHLRIPAIAAAVVFLAGVAQAQQTHADAPFRQARAIHFANQVDLSGYELRTVRSDRDGKMLVNTNKGLLKAEDGRLLRYREMAGIETHDHFDLELLNGRFVFLTDRLLLPLQGAGVDFRHNTQTRWTRVAPAAAGRYLLLSDAKIAECRGGEVREQPNPGYREALFNPHDGSFVLYGPDRLGRWANGTLSALPLPPAKITGAVVADAHRLMLATQDGLFAVDVKAGAAVREPTPLPWKELTCIARDADGQLWLGSKRGAFCIEPGGRVRYYAGRRWLQNDQVIDLHVDARGDVLLLTPAGVSRIDFEPMTLADKAGVHLANLRRHHIRYGLVSDIMLQNADYVTARLRDTDNDGLWSAMYLAAECYRYAQTRADDALANALDGFDALERLVTISGIPGFQARTFELDGFKVSDPERWRTRPERDFEWKGHTSSDEIVGTFFFHAVFSETVAQDRPELRRRCAEVVIAIVDHIIDHRLYLIDVDGKPTLWGRWNPEYVNTDAVGGDRRLNSVEILSFLQLAWHLTGRQRYKDTFYDLVNRHGYAENTVRYLPDPMGEWNHSDDELYWLSYYNLLRFCFDEKLKATFVESARAHAKATARKRNPLWNFIHGAATGERIDLEGAVFILTEYPLDNRDWRMSNSHRQDIRIDARPGVEPESAVVLSPAERRVHKWNSNEMALDGGGAGNEPESGAEYLLPYWMGRHFGYIAPPAK